MKYKMIALDLDGTLTNTQKIITEKTKSMLMRAQEAGVTVVLASGRPVFGMDALADELGLDVYGGFVLAFNGAKIINWKTKEVVFSKAVPDERLTDIYSVCKELCLPLLTHEGRQLITESPDDEYVKIEAKINHMPIKRVESYKEYINFPVFKFIATGSADVLKKAEPRVRGFLSPDCDVYRSTPFFLEIVAAGVDKADSLEMLANKDGCGMGSVIACGDGFNDIKMIKRAGLGVAMQNAEEVLKREADYITASNDDDGVAQVLEEFVFKEMT